MALTKKDLLYALKDLPPGALIRMIPKPGNVNYHLIEHGQVGDATVEVREATEEVAAFGIISLAEPEQAGDGERETQVVEKKDVGKVEDVLGKGATVNVPAAKLKAKN